MLVSHIFFKSLVNSLSSSKQKEGGEDEGREEPYFEEVKGLDNISSILVIGYSDFDTTLPRDEREAILAQNKVRYNFIGLPEQIPHSKNVIVNDGDIDSGIGNQTSNISNAKAIEDTMIEEFKKITDEILARPSRMSMLFDSIQQLQSDPVFKDNKVIGWFQEKIRKNVHIFLRI